jgi:O-antigen ligase
VTDAGHHTTHRRLEGVVAVHVALFVIGVSWAFGGNADWVRTPISIWGSVGILLTVIILAARTQRAPILPGTLAWCLPILAINVLVVASFFNPGMKALSFGGEKYLAPIRLAWWLPSAARPELALRALWLFDGIYFSCFNIALCISRRRVIRTLLGIVVANALALSVFGTVQKFVGSTGIYFGAVKSPQDYFFASFVYDNHWGAFIILMMGTCFGLILRYLWRPGKGSFLHGPALTGLVAAFIIGITVPLSGARACTILLGVMIAAALLKGAPQLSRSLQASGIRPGSVNIGLAAVIIAAGYGAWILAGDVINARASKAREQIAAAWAQGGLGSRAILYHDTWRMAGAHPAFGWGMGSFPTVFSLYNTQVPKGDRIPVVYHDAHSDWLQSLSEIGIVGTILIGAAVALPALATFKKRKTPIPYFALTGCALVAVYALVEFPFGNVAVVLSWWLCFFCATQYLRLTDGAEVVRQTS